MLADHHEQSKRPGALKSKLRIAVLGAGIMGCSVALSLARKGAHVSLIDHASQPFAGASRWNEGKIHLGYLYAADPSLDTARKLIPGGLGFRDTVEDLLGCDISAAVSPHDDIYLVHRRSVVDVNAMSDYFDAVSRLVREQPQADRYLGGRGHVAASRLTAAELSNVTASEHILAGFRVPERSVRTNWLADGYIAAIGSERSIDLILNTSVKSVAASAERWLVVADPRIEGEFDAVVNSLWENRAVVDAASGFASPDETSYRFRASVFLHTERHCSLPNAVIALGPFGDIKNYNAHDLYLSWYPVGLVEHRLGAPVPVDLNAEVRHRIAESTVEALRDYFPDLPAIVRQSSSLTLAGGWVVAHGTGSLADIGSPLHRRDRFGVSRFGSYYSVDTGKYATAPWIAERLAGEIMSRGA